MASKSSERLRQLRRHGYQVKVSHLRHPTEPATVTDGAGASVVVSLASLVALRNYGLVPSPKGGETHVEILDGNGGPLARGIAKCSAADTFNRRIGLAIALGRAEKALKHVPLPEPA